MLSFFNRLLCKWRGHKWKLTRIELPIIRVLATKTFEESHPQVHESKMKVRVVITACKRCGIVNEESKEYINQQIVEGFYGQH